MKLVIGGLVAFLAFLAGAAFVSLFELNLSIVPEKEASITLSYADLAAINMTAATIALGAVAVVVTVAAVFGFQVIRTASIRSAENRVAGELPRLLTNELGKMEKDGRLTRALSRAIYSGGEDAEDDASVANQ